MHTLHVLDKSACTVLVEIIRDSKNKYVFQRSRIIGRNFMIANY